MKRDDIYTKHSHKFMITDTLQKIIKNEEPSKPNLFGSDLLFSQIITSRIETAKAKPSEFNTSEEVKIKKFK